MRDHRHEWTPEELAAAERLSKQLDADALKVAGAEMQFGNRAARRRAAKQRRTITVGGNMVVSGSGQGVNLDVEKPRGQMPAKVDGRHRWVGIASFTIDKPGGDQVKPLDMENLLDVNVGCIDCEAPWSERLERTRCPAGDEWGTR